MNPTCKKVKNTGITFREDVLARLDAARGDIPRSRFLQRLVEKELALEAT